MRLTSLRQRLRLDEVDELEIQLFDSALGQPMDKRGIRSQVVASSTHQYADGTMTELLRRANERGWPVHEWCWRENIGGRTSAPPKSQVG
jgi:hypothetical protein